MLNYIIRRLLLLPLTLFCILLVNFFIINLAPGEPVTVSEISQEGLASRSADRSMAYGADERYLQFRERYGLTLPVLLNFWPWIQQKQVEETLQKIISKKASPNSPQEMPVKEYDALRIEFGDQARYIMPKLLQVLQDSAEALPMRIAASQFFSRGGTRQAYLGPHISPAQMQFNAKIARDNNLLRSLTLTPSDSEEARSVKIANLSQWYQENKDIYTFEPTSWQKFKMIFVDTRLCRYLSRVVMLDFGTLRNDDNKTVISEVTRRFKYSLTLALLPMCLTFFFCQLFGALMAYKQNRWIDYTLSIFFLLLYALPVFVVAPFLIEEVALNHDFPFTHVPMPISGFTSPDSIYDNLVSYQRLLDVFEHIFLPLVAIIYGTLAAQSRLSRTAVLEVLRQDYVRTARAKGVSPGGLFFRHVGRNAGITIVTSLASSLGVVLGGSLIVETLFEINGFGKFFYDAVINRDYNVIMFSTLAGSFLSLIGYLAADLAYTMLDPRLTLE
jgi:peptide/nickel transport system permease protein